MWGRLLGAIVIILVGSAIINLFLPSRSHVERVVDIAASPDTVFSILNDLQRFKEWSPWSARDPDTKYVYSGPDKGVGARMEWVSKRRDNGKGWQQITATALDRSLTSDLAFGVMNPSKERFDLAPSALGTQVTWSFDSDLGLSPVSRYFGLVLARMVGPDFERGLRNLKAVAEKDRMTTANNGS